MDPNKLYKFLDQVRFPHLERFARQCLDLTETDIEDAENKKGAAEQKYCLIDQWRLRVGHEGTFDNLMELYKKFSSEIKATSHAGVGSQPSNHPSGDTSESPTVSNFSEAPVGPQRLASAGPGNLYNPRSVNKNERELQQQVHSPTSERPSRTLSENEVGLGESENKEENSTHCNNAMMPSAREERTQDEIIRPVTTVLKKASYANESTNSQYEDAGAMFNMQITNRTFASEDEREKDNYFEIVAPPPSSIVVDDCSKQFALRLNDNKEYYPILDKEFKGYILIFNNTFKHASDKRKGSKIDVKNLKRLWKEIGGCKVLEKSDLSAEDMKAEISRFVTSEKGRKCGFVAFFIMSHGNSEYYSCDGAERVGEGYIFGNDRRKVMISDILKMMENGYPGTTLHGIPKLIFFQACRGVMLDGGVPEECQQATVVADKCSSPNGTGMAHKMPSASDILTSYATQKGYQALRDELSGTWFINAIVNVFRMHAKSQHVGDLMTKVNEAVSQEYARLKSGDGCMEMSETTSTLRRKLLLFPGQENEDF